jgi:hypothetical protein
MTKALADAQSRYTRISSSRVGRVGPRWVLSTSGYRVRGSPGHARSHAHASRCVEEARADQISATQPCVSRSRPAQTAGAKSGPPVTHPPAPYGRWGLSSALRLRRATRPTSRRAASGLRPESHDEPKVQRTSSMTGNVAIATKLTAEGYGGQSGSAYRRSGGFGLCESTRATGPAQAPARICREKKRRHKFARRLQRQRRCGPAWRPPYSAWSSMKISSAVSKSRPRCSPSPLGGQLRSAALIADATDCSSLGDVRATGRSAPPLLQYRGED